MDFVRPKKRLGQHFLRDPNIAAKIARSLRGHGGYRYLLEVGPGTGMLTRFLLSDERWEWHGIEIDPDSVSFLRSTYPVWSERIMEGDFLKTPLDELFAGEPLGVIGNFPYHISSQIVFRVIRFRHLVPEMVGMFQKELAQRLAASPGSKTYGVISVLTQAYYDVRLLFHIGPKVFDPPPKVHSSVVHLQRKECYRLSCDDESFVRLVKAAFNQRRKTLHNALKAENLNWEALPAHWARLRAEQLSVADFIRLTHACRSA